MCVWGGGGGVRRGSGGVQSTIPSHRSHTCSSGDQVHQTLDHRCEWRCEWRPSDELLLVDSWVNKLIKNKINCLKWMVHGSWLVVVVYLFFFLNFKASQRYDAKRSDSDENTLWAKFLVISPHFLFFCITNVITILWFFFFYFFFFFSMWVRLRLWLKVLTFSLAIIWFNSKRQHERRSTAPWATINSQRRPTLPRTLLFLLTLIEV